MNLEWWSQLASVLSFITSVISIILVFLIRDKTIHIENKMGGIENIVLKINSEVKEYISNQQNNSGTIINTGKVNINNSGTKQSVNISN